MVRLLQLQVAVQVDNHPPHKSYRRGNKEVRFQRGHRSEDGIACPFLATQTLSAQIAAKDKGHRLGRLTIWSGRKAALCSCWLLTLISCWLSREPDAVLLVRAGLQPGLHDLANVIRLACDADRPCGLGLREVLTPILCDMEIDLVIGSGPDNETV